MLKFWHMPDYVNPHVSDFPIYVMSVNLETIRKLAHCRANVGCMLMTDGRPTRLREDRILKLSVPETLQTSSLVLNPPENHKTSCLMTSILAVFEQLCYANSQFLHQTPWNLTSGSRTSQYVAVMYGRICHLTKYVFSIFFCYASALFPHIPHNISEIVALSSFK